MYYFPLFPQTSAERRAIRNTSADETSTRYSEQMGVQKRTTIGQQLHFLIRVNQLNECSLKTVDKEEI